MEDIAPYLVEEMDSEGNVVGQKLFEWPYYEVNEDDEMPEPEIIGHKLEFDVEDTRQYPQKYAKLLSALENDGFIFKCEYNEARAYLKILTDKIQVRRDYLNDLL